MSKNSHLTGNRFSLKWHPALGLTDQIERATEELAESAHRPVQYLPSSSQRKQDVAREIAERDGVTQGLVCVFWSVYSGHGANQLPVSASEI